MESYLRRGYIEFLTLSPVFIGSGKEQHMSGRFPQNV